MPRVGRAAAPTQPTAERRGSVFRAAMPKAWPEDVAYLTAPVYSKTLAEDALGAILVTKTDLSPKASTPPVGPCSAVTITKISDPAHPAHGQHGLFARRHLPAGSFVLCYLGVVHSDDDADETSDYDLSLDAEHNVGVDAARSGNEARFVNDYRGVSSLGPNAEFRDVWVDVGRGTLEKRIAVCVLPAGKSGKRARGIAKGEEILVSYGKPFWNARKGDEALHLDATVGCG